jgi:hypothetical protein
MKIRFLLAAAAVFAAAGISSTQAAVLLDFGSSATPGSPASDGQYWNVIPDSQAITPSGTISLFDSTNAASSLTFTITTRFKGPTNGGPATNSVVPNAVGSDAFFGDNTLTDPGIFVIGGLDPTLTYDFTFFSARNATGNRMTRFTVGSDFVEVQSALNTSTLVSLNGLVPVDLGGGVGQITVALSVGTGNDQNFTYINSLQIVAVPEPSSLALMILGGVGCLMIPRKRRRL